MSDVIDAGVPSKSKGVPWKPGQVIADRFTEASHPPYVVPQIDVPAQDTPWVARIQFGGRSKSDEGAIGGAELVWRNLSDQNASDIAIAYAPVHSEFSGINDPKEDYVVNGEIRYLIRPHIAWRVTELWEVGHDHWVNCYLRVIFESTVKSNALPGFPDASGKWPAHH